MGSASTPAAAEGGPDTLLGHVASMSRERPTLFRLRVYAVLLGGYGLIFGLVGLPVTAFLLAFTPLILRDRGFSLLIGTLVGVTLLAGIVAARRRGNTHPTAKVPGLPVTREGAPDLFAAVDPLCAALGLPAFGEIRITREMDASLLRASDAGLFGRQRLTLLIGLPLMKCFSHGQLRAVLAHELGHAHGPLATVMTRIAQIEVRVRRLQEALAKSTRRGGRLMRAWAERYLRQLHACALPLSRAAEHEADSIAVRLTSAAKLAEALVVALIAGDYWRHAYWPRIYAQMRHISHPAFFPFTSFGSLYLTALSAEEVNAYLEAQLAARSPLRAFSPSLGERLRAIGASAAWAPPQPGAAADTLLGGERRRVDAHFDQEWREAVAPFWRQQYDAINRAAPGATGQDTRTKQGLTL